MKIDDEEGGEGEVEESNNYSKPEPERVLSMVVPRRRDAPPGALFKDKENSHYVERYVLNL